MISIILPVIIQNDFQMAMTEFTVWCMRNLTKVPNEFVIVETESSRCEHLADVWINNPKKTSYTKDWNMGAEAASGDYLVHIGNDVIVTEGWLEAMLACFESNRDCGIATVSVHEPGHFVGPTKPQWGIVESFYGAVMMFKKLWRLDSNAYPDQMSDYDLCMRIYEAGLRSYRNNSNIAYHLKEITYSGLHGSKVQERFNAGLTAFRQRWDGTHYLIKDIILNGVAHYGREGSV